MIKILLDTDLGSDCDDAGALAVLHRLADEKLCEIVAMTHCTSEINGAVTVKAINTWYKRPDIPIGQYKDGPFLEDEKCMRYTKPIAAEYLKDHSMPEFEDSVRVIRRALAEERDVVIVVIGMLNNIAGLIKSEADDISPLTGRELVRQSVKAMYVMGGHFEDLTYAEYNIVQSGESAQYVSQNFSKPIVYCGYELGDKVVTGQGLNAVAEDHPVRRAYCIWNNYVWGKAEPLRCSWDLITVYCAVMQDTPLYKKSKAIGIDFDSDGRVVLSDGSKDCYMVADCNAEEAERALNELLY